MNKRKKETTNSADDPRCNLASVSVLLEQPEIISFAEAFSRPIALDAINEALDLYRQNLKPGDSAPSVGEIVATVEECLLRNQLDRLRPVVNATGIILHTGLGRAVLPQKAADALAQMNRCCNLQVDLETGKRGKRNYMTEYLLCKITGAEGAMVVNNNAAATFLILSALCCDKEVIISRGQLIEIGGSFRLPDCIHQSGAIMIDVGTTNKTHLRDYEKALSENTGAILRCHPSNYRIVGFTQEIDISELVTLKEKQPVVVIDDLGCGALIDLSEFGLPKEPTVQESIAAGADLVCFSGDKLISGPQAGIIVGKKELIDKIKKHPLTRMLRAGKLTDMALEHTLRLFLDPQSLIKNNPTLRMLTLSAKELKKRAIRLQKSIKKANLPIEARVIESESATGGGSLPGITIKTFAIAVSSPNLPPDSISCDLRKNTPPVIARIAGDEVLFDMRTLLDGDDDIIVNALERLPL